MTPTRRDLGVLAATAVFIPRPLDAWATPKLVIADGGASAARPADTRGAFELAIAEGSDFLAAGLVATQEGILVARRDNELSTTTDVADRSEFGDRRIAKIIGQGQAIGWFTEDFTVAELKTLVCRRGEQDARRSNAADPLSTILTFQEVIDIARAGSVRTGRVIGVYPIMRRAAYFASIGLPLEPRLADAVRANGYNSPAAAMFIGAEEAPTLRAFGAASRARRVQIVGSGRAVEILDASGLATIRTWAEGIGPDEELARGLTGPAHAVGLAVHAWAADISRNGDESRAGLTSLLVGGADGVVTVSPATAVRARSEVQRALNYGNGRTIRSRSPPPGRS